MIKLSNRQAQLMSNSTTINTDPSPQRHGYGRRWTDRPLNPLANLLARIPDGIISFDREWRITFANPEACKICRITSADFNKKTHWELFPSTIGSTLEHDFRAAMEEGIPSRFEYYYSTYDIWIDIHVFPTEDGVTGYFRDITDRKGAEYLRDSASRQLLQVLEATTDAVVSINRDRNFTFLNRRAKELLAVKGDLLGKNIWEEFPAAIRQGAYLYHFNRAMDQGIPSEFEEYYPEPLNLWLSFQLRPSGDGLVAFFRDITARHHSDLSLKEQQNLLAVVQQTAHVATWDIDITTGRITFGPGSYPVFGHPLADLPDLHTAAKILPPDYVSILADLIQKTIATGEMIVLDFPVLAANGETLWVESRGQALQVNGQPTRLRGLSIDITDRKRNEDALITSEARYRILADLNPQAIWMGAPNGSVTYANQGLLDYLGFTIDDLSRDGWLNAFHSEDRKHVIETWDRSVATGVDFDLEARLIRARDGRARWWWVRAQPVRDDTGAILHWLGVNIDIDDRKTFAETLQQRQEETERQRAELETIYETAPVGLALFEPVEFRYLRINGRQAETIGLPKDKILGRRITEIAPLKGLDELFQQVAAGHSIRNHVLEGELPSHPGELRTWNVSCSPVSNIAGKVEAIAAVILEITNQKKAEAALIQSEKLAAVGRLASSISHEINNPLESITNLLYLVAVSDNLPPNLADYIQTAQSELSRVCQIATQTLRFHRQAVRATFVTAAELVDAVLNLYHGRLANSSIHVEATYETTTPILCFENDIRQVLNNLIANAIDAMRKGGRLIVRAHDGIDHATDRRGVRITIADTGHGMSPAVRARLFEPFYTTKELNGTGLGLWISSGIVNHHQGRLTLRSTEHRIHHGTVFTIFLPYAEQPET
jgi:PAS domain S-box-containing protein